MSYGGRKASAAASARLKKSAPLTFKKKTKDPNAVKKPPKPSQFRLLSPALSAFLGGETKLTRQDVTARLRTYIAEKGLKDPKDGRKILNDEKLQEVFKCKTMTFFNMNAKLSPHLKNPKDVVE